MENNFLYCWKCSGCFENKQKTKKLIRLLTERRVACVNCGTTTLFLLEKNNFISHKLYKCDNSHLTCVSPFSNGTIHLRYGNESDDFININGTINQIDNLESFRCYHLECNQKLHPLNNDLLDYPNVLLFKTRTRVGDLWDKDGIEPVKPGRYNNNTYEYEATKTEQANKHRLKNMRRPRNIPIDKLPGRPKA